MGTLRLQSLKMLFVFLIPLLGFVHGTCWFDKLCKEDELTGENQLELATKKMQKLAKMRVRVTLIVTSSNTKNSKTRVTVIFGRLALKKSRTKILILTQDQK